MATSSVISPAAVLGDGVQIGEHVVIHAGVVLGDGVVVQDGVVLGKAPALGARSTASRERPAALEIGAGAAVCAGAVVFAGARIAAGAIVGDQAYVRERAVIGEATVVGRGSCVDNDVTVGARVRIQTGVYLTAYSLVEDDVFLGPGALTTNDQEMGRRDPTQPLTGATLRRACRIGGAAVLLPGVEVGEEAFVAAASVVTRAVPARTLVMGSPARFVRDIRDDEVLGRWS